MKIAKKISHAVYHGYPTIDKKIMHDGLHPYNMRFSDLKWRFNWVITNKICK